VVVRAFRWGSPGGPFWGGCHHLFGIDPGSIFDLEPLNGLLARLSPIAVPRVRRKATLAGRSCVVVDYVPGAPLEAFDHLPESALEELGRALACIHCRRFASYGHPTGKPRHPLPTFHTRLAETMRLLVDQFYQHDARISAALEPMWAAALQLPPLEVGALVMIDLDPTQFLTDGEHLTGLIDTEAYVIGPRAFDFIALEYLLTQPGAAAVARGYAGLLPLPDLVAVRPVYRYFYRLLEAQGKIDLAEWMARPRVFVL
jgi:Ser/Thr protein kinase RdoA (MazF antagonist)